MMCKLINNRLLINQYCRYVTHDHRKEGGILIVLNELSFFTRKQQMEMITQSFDLNLRVCVNTCVKFFSLLILLTLIFKTW